MLALFQFDYMIISPSTRIGAVIKGNPKAIETLVSLSPHFNKLKNPVLRRLLAPRVTIAEAALIGDCPVEKIIDSLVLIGFEVKTSIKASNPLTHLANDDINIEPVISHDARVQLAAGEDPLNAILKKLSGVRPNETMLVTNSFEPVPLIRILKAKGYLIAVSKKAPGLVYTYITRMHAADQPDDIEPPTTEDAGLFDEILKHYNLKFTEVDVREMEMPRPMITILNELEQLQSWEALYVRHKKIPVYLLPELRERNFKYVFKKAESEVIILIYPSYACN